MKKLDKDKFVDLWQLNYTEGLEYLKENIEDTEIIILINRATDILDELEADELGEVELEEYQMIDLTEEYEEIIAEIFEKLEIEM